MIFPAYAAEWPFETRVPDDVGARALALGNAYTAIAEGATGGFWNPAGIIQSPGVALMGQMKLNERQQWAFDPKAIRFTYHRWGAFWGNKIAIRLPERTPDFTYYALAYQLTSRFAVGASLSFRRRHPWLTYQWFGIEPQLHLGMLVNPWAPLRLAFMSYGSERLDLAGSLRWRWLQLAGRLHWDGSKVQCFAGSELTWSSWSMRVGWASTVPTAGLGYRWRSIHVDYALVRDNGEVSHFLSMDITR